MTIYKNHYSVMNKDVLEYLKKAAKMSESNLFADLTFGGGGHALKILEEIKGSFLVAFDQDPEAFKNGINLLKQKSFADRYIFYHTNFENFNFETKKLSKGFAGIIADLGVSSHHFDSGERGFSFKKEAPLDMRMNNDDFSLKTAAQLLMELSEEQISQVLLDYGEERFAKKIAKLIINRRKEGKVIKTTKELEELVFHAYPKKMRYARIGPATKTFQALRIAVNRELEVLKKTIPKLIPCLEVGGVLAIISFHSLEDRIVKKAFKQATQGEIPVEILTKKPRIPDKEEVFENSRSRSAKLRVIRRVFKKKTNNKYQEFSSKE